MGAEWGIIEKITMPFASVTLQELISIVPKVTAHRSALPL